MTIINLRMPINCTEAIKNIMTRSETAGLPGFELIQSVPVILNS